MPKYTDDLVAGYVLYFTSKCVSEAMHVHASDKELSEVFSAKLFVYENGDSKIVNHGSLNDRELAEIQEYIKANHETMFEKWTLYSDNGYYLRR